MKLRQGNDSGPAAAQRGPAFGLAGSRDLDVTAGQFDAERPLGLYVHFPFCSLRCPYCSFAVDTRVDIPHVRYADAVLSELESRAPCFGAIRAATPAGAPACLVSIYFGGGTPGLWAPAQIARIIARAQALFQADGVELEITVEANPGELTSDGLAALRAAGVNRLSLGVQSFDDRLLAEIGRNHDRAGACAGIARARAAGFENLSCDLMFGLPGQTEADWQADLDRLIAVGPEHVSVYGLTIERGTRFGALARAGRLAPLDDAVSARMYTMAQEALAGAGYVQYEVSSYARPGRRAIHNQLYWTQGAYLGLGCSAASFRPLADGSAYRFRNPRATNTYLAAVAACGGAPRPAQAEYRVRDELENEALWLALRTADGVDREVHRRRFARDPLTGARRLRAAEACAAAGWLAISPGHLRPTARGLLFADELALRFWD